MTIPLKGSWRDEYEDPTSEDFQEAKEALENQFAESEAIGLVLGLKDPIKMEVMKFFLHPNQYSSWNEFNQDDVAAVIQEQNKFDQSVIFYVQGRG